MVIIGSQLPQLMSDSCTALPSSEVELTRQKLAHLMDEYSTSHNSLSINLYNVSIYSELC